MKSDDSSNGECADLADAIVSQLESLEEQVEDSNWKESPAGQCLNEFVSSEGTFLKAMLFFDANNLSAHLTFHTAWSVFVSGVNAQLDKDDSKESKITMEQLATIMLPCLKAAVPQWCAELVGNILDVTHESPDSSLVRITNGLFEREEQVRALTKLRASCVQNMLVTVATGDLRFTQDYYKDPC